LTIVGRYILPGLPAAGLRRRRQLPLLRRFAGPLALASLRFGRSRMLFPTVSRDCLVLFMNYAGYHKEVIFEIVIVTLSSEPLVFRLSASRRIRTHSRFLLLLAGPACAGLARIRLTFVPQLNLLFSTIFRS
jgi:hypothetical protein